jgi:NTE family protein
MPVVALLSCLALLGGVEPSTVPATAQATRPRVGLVLSGGGALGLAHVGVIKVLEELRVPVDVVAGTSMGAIVGGLYAAGYSAEELERIALTLDWRELLQDEPDRRQLPFRRKVDDLTYLTRWEIGVSGGKLRLPSGLIAGHKLGATLQLLALRAPDVRDFDLLPLPFRAVAADIGTGDTVVLDHGSLGKALRASMAVPGLFAPVEIDGRLLVDGGIVANLPVAAARAMGAEIIIAVDVGQPLREQKRPESAAAIISRTADLMTRLNVERTLPDVDILVRPQMQEFGSLEFAKAAKILPQGVAAARQMTTELARLTVDEEAWRAYLVRQRRSTPAVRVSSLVIDPGPGLAPKAVAGAVHTQPGTTLDPELLRADLRRLWELGDFELVGFDLERAGEGYDLTITARPKPWGPNYLRFGLGVSADLEGSSEFNALNAFTMTRLNRLGGEIKTALQMGAEPLVSAEIYQPLASSHLPFASVTALYSQRKFQVPIGTDLIQYRSSLERGVLDLGLAFGRYGELRAGIRRDRISATPSGDENESLPRYELNDGGLRLALTIDQIDSTNFPRNGVLLSSELFDARPNLGADERYHRLDLVLLGASSLGRHTLVGIAQGSSALGGELPENQRLQLGGLFHLSGLAPGEVSGNYGGSAALIYLFRIARLPNFGEGLYVGLSLEAGNAWENSSAASLSDLRRSVAVVFGADTMLGPVYLAHGTTSGGKDSFYLYLGRTF